MTWMLTGCAAITGPKPKESVVTGAASRPQRSAACNSQAAANHLPDSPELNWPQACHDLRQPLQTLVLMHELLVKTVDGARQQALLVRVGRSLEAMTAILDNFTGPDRARNTSTDSGMLEPSLPESPWPDAGISTTQPNTHSCASTDLGFAPVVFIVDDDAEVRAAIRSVLEDEGQCVQEFASCEAFLEHHVSDHVGCLLLDAYLPAMNGLQLLQKLQKLDCTIPTIMMTGNSDVPMAVDAMKAGAVDFIEKPIGRLELLACIARAVELSQDQNKRFAWSQDAARHVAGLTARQRQIMDLVLAGHPSKNIAADLGISQRTVENHRAAIMTRTGTKSLPELARLAVAAAQPVAQTRAASTV
jgi:FixJ family two-component response regulator